MRWRTGSSVKRVWRHDSGYVVGVYQWSLFKSKRHDISTDYIHFPPNSRTPTAGAAATASSSSFSFSLFFSFRVGWSTPAAGRVPVRMCAVLCVPVLFPFGIVRQVFPSRHTHVEREILWIVQLGFAWFRLFFSRLFYIFQVSSLRPATIFSVSLFFFFFFFWASSPLSQTCTRAVLDLHSPCYFINCLWNTGIVPTRSRPSSTVCPTGLEKKEEEEKKKEIRNNFLVGTDSISNSLLVVKALHSQFQFGRMLFLVFLIDSSRSLMSLLVRFFSRLIY